MPMEMRLSDVPPPSDGGFDNPIYHQAFVLILSVNAHIFSCLQICTEFDRFSVYLPAVKVGNFFGGLPVQAQKKLLADNTPHIVVGTPGRVKQVRCPPPPTTTTISPHAPICALMCPPMS